MSRMERIKAKARALVDEFNESKLELYTKIQMNDRAELNLGAIFGLGIGIIFIAAIAPAAIETFYATNTTNWTINGVEDTKTTTIYWLLPFIAIAVFLYMLYRRMQ